MPVAKSIVTKQPTRRAILAATAAVSVASLPVLAVPVPVGATAASDDTLARIAAHRDATRLLEKIVARMWETEKEIPDDRRKAYSIKHRGTDIGRDDDPRWTAVNAQYWDASDHEVAVAWSFVDRPPTTIEGAAAILAYADEYEEAGYEWPNSRHHFTAAGAYAGNTEEDWRKSLNRAIIPALCSTSSSISLLPETAGAAVLPALPAVQSGPRCDPIHAAIEAHKHAWDELEQALTEANRAGVEDPDVDHLHTRIDDAADGLVDVLPTSLAGVVALLSYAAEFAQGGNIWPTGYKTEHPRTRWDREHGVSWDVILHHNLARALPRIAAA